MMMDDDLGVWLGHDRNTNDVRKTYLLQARRFPPHFIDRLSALVD